MSNINEGQRNSFLVESSCPNKTTQNTEEKKSQLFPPQKKKQQHAVCRMTRIQIETNKKGKY